MSNLLKRAFDFTLAFLGLILSLPLLLIFSIAIYMEDKGPVFFLQERCGKNGKLFKIIKLRTMLHGGGKDNLVVFIDNDPRVTKIGRLLRATAMDELPTLVNILKGEVSFVGPRALPYKIDDEEKIQYANITMVPGYNVRSSVKPGLTGIAQVYAPKDIGRRNKFRYDNIYVKNRSLWLDIRLILLSFWFTFKGRWESRDK